MSKKTIIVVDVCGIQFARFTDCQHEGVQVGLEVTTEITPRDSRALLCFNDVAAIPGGSLRTIFFRSEEPQLFDVMMDHLGQASGWTDAERFDPTPR